MNVFFKLYSIRMTDESTGKTIVIKTVRSLKEIVADMQELEKEAAQEKIETTLAEIYTQPEE